MNEANIYIMIRSIVGAVATLLAILLWTKTRDTAWVMVIITVILSYIAVLFSILNIFGFTALLTSSPLLNIIFTILFENLPTVFLSLALIIMIRRRT